MVKRKNIFGNNHSCKFNKGRKPLKGLSFWDGMQFPELSLTRKYHSWKRRKAASSVVILLLHSLHLANNFQNVQYKNFISRTYLICVLIQLSELDFRFRFRCNNFPPAELAPDGYMGSRYKVWEGSFQTWILNKFRNNWKKCVQTVIDFCVKSRYLYGKSSWIIATEM